MATIKSYTDIEQSRKLAEILPLESADMFYDGVQDLYKENVYNIPLNGSSITVRTGHIITQKGIKTNLLLPCWTLAALFELLPYELCDDDGNSSYLQINKEDDLYQLVYTDPYGDFGSIETDRYEHFLDVCYEMIIKFHKLNLL